MANYYTKLFQGILDSTIWHEPLATKVVWITMLAMADREGAVLASLPGLADRAKVSREECEQALETFFAPDADSRSQEHEGRRVEKIDGGWRLLNHGKYRQMMGSEDRREYQRIKQAEYRKKKKGGQTTSGPPLPGETAYVKNFEDGYVDENGVPIKPQPTLEDRSDATFKRVDL